MWVMACEPSAWPALSTAAASQVLASQLLQELQLDFSQAWSGHAKSSRSITFLRKALAPGRVGHRKNFTCCRNHFWGNLAASAYSDTSVKTKSGCSIKLLSSFVCIGLHCDVVSISIFLGMTLFLLSNKIEVRMTMRTFFYSDFLHVRGSVISIVNVSKFLVSTDCIFFKNGFYV